MSGLKTLAATALFAAGTAAQADPLHLFASCVGRLSAQMEHEWLLSDPAAATTEALRRTMIELLEAAPTMLPGRDVLALRIDAKMAHAALLTRATFSDDPADRAWSAARAADLVADCTGLLLS